VRKINFKIIMEETRENIMISATTLATITSLRKTKLVTIAERRDISSENADTRVPNSANLTKNETSEIIAMIFEMHISMITELHMAASTKSSDWWYDSGATIHVCNNKSQFKNYEEAVDGQEVLMGNSNTAKVMGKGIIELQFISGKKLILVNVLHVPEIRKNLVSANLLCKKGVKAVIESDNLIQSKQRVFVGKGYSCNGMYKLIINNIDSGSAYIIEFSIL